jgi:hypothetical protein
MGWTGLLLFIPTGIFLWWASYTSINIVETRNWLLMPFVLLVFRIGLSVDNAFVLMWLAPAVISIVILLLLKFGSQMMRSAGEERRAGPMTHLSPRAPLSLTNQHPVPVRYGEEK